MLITWAVFHPQYQFKSFNLMIILFFMPRLIYVRTNIVNNRCYCLSDVGDIVLHLQRVLIIISKIYYTIIDIWFTNFPSHILSIILILRIIIDNLLSVGIIQYYKATNIPLVNKLLFQVQVPWKDRKNAHLLRSEFSIKFALTY